MDDKGAPGSGGGGARPLESSIAIERTYRVGGKRVTVQAVLPSTLAKEIGMEAMLACAQRLVLTMDSKETHVEQVRMGQS